MIVRGMKLVTSTITCCPGQSGNLVIIGCNKHLHGHLDRECKNGFENLLLVHVRDEVLLALELDGQVDGGDVFEGPLLRLIDLVLFHSVIRLNYLQTRQRDSAF